MKSIIVLLSVLLISSVAVAQEELTKLNFKNNGVDAARKLVIQHEQAYRDAIKGGMMVPEDISIAERDISGDEAMEIFAYIPTNSLYCGSSGCSLTVYDRTGNSLNKVMDVVTYDDVSTSSIPTMGHRDIVLRDGKGKPLRWKFNGKEYYRK